MRSLVRTSIAVMLGLFLAIPFVSPAQAAKPRNLFYGDSYGSFSFVGNSVMTGRTAYSVMGCQTPPGTHIENTMGSNEEDPEEPTGENNGPSKQGSVATSASAIQNTNVTKSLTTARAGDVSMFKGRITASRVKAVSATFNAGDGMETSPAGTVLKDLVVDGRKFEVQPGPNTTILLAGLGYVVLNEQSGTTGGPMPNLTVNGIHVYVNQPNAFGVPIGSQYIVSHAFSALKNNVAGIVTGQAYGHKLFEGGRAQSGPSSVVYLPCAGTNGKVAENTAAAVGQGMAFRLGTIKDTAQGKVGSKAASGVTTATVESVKLLGGLITADLVQAVARVSKKGDTIALSDAGSKFVNLVVAGRRIGNETGPNRAIKVPGVGFLWLHQISRTKSGIKVQMMNLEVTETNPFGLKPGSKLQLAVAYAAVLP